MAARLFAQNSVTKVIEFKISLIFNFISFVHTTNVYDFLTHTLIAKSPRKTLWSRVP